MTKSTLLFAAAAMMACGSGSDAPPKPPSAADALAAAAATKSLPPENYVSPTAKFELTLPGAWTGKYRTEERKDTTAGAHLGVEFRFVPDSGSKAPSLTLMTLRIFTKAAWARAATRTSVPVGTKIAEDGDRVFVLSLPQSNPYPPASPEAPVYDQLIISIAQGGQQIHLTPR